MRNSSTRFVSLLLAVVMVFSLALTGYAAERTPLLVLHGDEKEPVLNGRVTVCVDTTVDAVLADGKLTIRYDSQKLQFLSAKGGEAWRDNTDLSLQVNSNEAGKLVVAFAGEEPAMVGTAICLSFQAIAEGASSVMVVEEGSYVTGAEGYTLEARTVVEVGGHNWSQWKVIKAATCTEAGEESRTCLNCGEVEKRTVPATGHQWGEWAVTKAATCTEAGEETRTCTLCGEKETRAIAATGSHTWGEWKTLEEATCTSNGVQERECTVCHEKETKLILELGHAYTEQVVAPTCETAGYTLHTCSRCQHSYVDSIVEALGHNYEKQVTAPTHDKMGYSTSTCTRCHHSYVADYTDALGHEYTQKVTKEPTCTEEGVMTFTCSCGKTYTESIPKKEHTYQDEVTKPDCTHMGYTTHTCTVCGHSYQDSFVDALGHDCEAKTVPATCTGYGYTENTCKRCDYTYISEITQPLGHKGETVNAKEATCTEDGYTGDLVCSVCGEVLEQGEAIAKGHTWSDWTVTREPECFQDGERTRTCTVCGETEREVLPANEDHCPSRVFADVDTSRWYHEGVDHVVREKLMNGVSETLFHPNHNLTRGELVTVLYRMAGTPAVEASTPFTDVAEGRFYSDAVAWAYENEITEGVTDTLFAPNTDVTREQLVTFLYRYAQRKGLKTDAVGSLDQYPDAGSIGNFAVEPMTWAVTNGIVDGLDGKLAPKAASTRAQIATVIMRFETADLA